MFVSKVAVVGGGALGGEIAQVVAMADVEVVLLDLEEEGVEAGLERARAMTRAQLDAAVGRGRLSPESAERHLGAILERIAPASGFAGAGDVDFVVDAGRGERHRRQAIFAGLDAATPGHAILAAGTPGGSVTQLAEVTSRPDKVIGFRFFAPPSANRLVEVVAGEDASPQTLQAATTFAQALRKTPVRCEDAPGGIVDRILISAASEAWRHQEATQAEPEAVDGALRDAGLVFAGPFHTDDPARIEATVATARALREAFGGRFHVHAGMEERARRAAPSGPAAEGAR